MKVTYATFLGEQHPLVFSLSASEKLDEAFGSLDGMEQALSSGRIRDVAKAADTVLTILLEAGRIYAAAAGLPLPKPLPCRPADLLDMRDPNALAVVFSAIETDSSREVEVEAKNAEATPGQ